MYNSYQILDGNLNIVYILLCMLNSQHEPSKRIKIEIGSLDLILLGSCDLISTTGAWEVAKNGK